MRSGCSLSEILRTQPVKPSTSYTASQTKHFVHSQSNQALRTQPIKPSISYTAYQTKRIFPKHKQRVSSLRDLFICARPHWKRALLATACASDIILHLVGHSPISFHASSEHIRSFCTIQPRRHLPSLAPQSLQLPRSAVLKRATRQLRHHRTCS